MSNTRGRSWRAAERILEDGGVPWGHQVSVMFQIVSALALEVPFYIDSLNGVSPSASLSCEPWGHTDHTGGDCTCVSSDSMAYPSLPRGFCLWRIHRCAGTGRPGSVPYVSQRPGAYGRLLLAVYVRWKTDLLVAFDWLRSVARGGGGLAGRSTSHRALCG